MPISVPSKSVLKLRYGFLTSLPLIKEGIKISIKALEDPVTFD